jgi:rhodanese-related sulfurtransferase
VKQEQMQMETRVAPGVLRERLVAGEPMELIDVRTPPEFSAGHVRGARNLPLDDLDAAAFCRGRACDAPPLYVLCQFGSRASRAIAKLEAAGVKGCVLVEGGTQAWIDAGFPVERGTSRVLPLMRQVQIVVGSVSAVGAVLALAVNPWFALIPLVMGSGLLFAGLTGICGLALVLARMPWNKSSHNPNASCCATPSR